MNMADAYRFREDNDPYRGLGRRKPHIMMLVGNWICFKLNQNGLVEKVGTGSTWRMATTSMEAIR